LGIPSISTKINGIPEAIKHLETGYLIEAGNSEALKNAIVKLKDDFQLREKLSKNGREFVLANFNEKVVAKIAIEKYIEAFRLK
jgi:glycosyltransferase involved in cell wall biosynthesis